MLERDLLSVSNVYCIPNKKLCKRSTAQTHPIASRAICEYLRSEGVHDRLKNAIGFSFASLLDLKEDSS